MANYRRVTYEDRCQIHAFLQVELSVPAIAKQLGFSKSTIYREIFRNRGKQKIYTAVRAQSLAKVRFRRCRRRRIIIEELDDYVRMRLFEGWSPEQISGRLRYESERGPSHQTIYNHVYRRRGQYLFCLRRYNKRGFGRSQRNRRVNWGLNIHERPKQVELRNRIGDWERDTLFIAQRKKLLVCTDRKSRYTCIEKVTDYTSNGMRDLTEAMLSSTCKKAFTMTNDNASEFNRPLTLRVPVYYCDPWKPQQRGTIENTIGLIREYVKVSTPMDSLSQDFLKEIQKGLNFRPRKCLDYKTPYEVFYGKSVALAI